MEQRKILVKCEGTKVYIGEMPQLVVDLQTQENYIEYIGGKMPYYREIGLSRDLLEGKRGNVLDTAIEHYYHQACSVLRAKSYADAFRAKKDDLNKS